VFIYKCRECIGVHGIYRNTRSIKVHREYIECREYIGIQKYRNKGSILEYREYIGIQGVYRIQAYINIQGVCRIQGVYSNTGSI